MARPSQDDYLTYRLPLISLPDTALQPCGTHHPDRRNSLQRQIYIDVCLAIFS